MSLDRGSRHKNWASCRRWSDAEDAFNYAKRIEACLVLEQNVTSASFVIT